MMDVTTRNFFRLLRAGAFHDDEPLEPMSAWKWRRLRQLATAHEVDDVVAEGAHRLGGDFFMPAWFLENPVGKPATGTAGAEREEDALVRADHLTNPLLNHRLQNILDDEDTTLESRQLMLMLSGITRHLLNKGIPVSGLVELGRYLRTQGGRVDYAAVQSWLHKLRMEPMAQLAGTMLTELFHFSKEEIPFMGKDADADITHIMKEMFHQKSSMGDEFYFSQGGDIFVHTANSSAMLGHLRRSARYFRYYPSESLTNFVASFAHSLSHIEE